MKNNKFFMKLIFSFLILGASISAKAKQVLPSELAALPKCTKQQCFKDDGGKEFLHLCEFMSSLPPYITAIGPWHIENKFCYCPCTFNYLSGAARE